MQLQLSILPISDDNVLSIFERLVNLVPNASNQHSNARVGDNAQNQPPLNIGAPLNEFRAQKGIAAILQQHGEILTGLTVSFQVPNPGAPPNNVAHGSLDLKREPDGTTVVTANLPPHWSNQPDIATPVLVEFRTAFQEYRRSNVLRDVSPVLDEFYKRMEAATVRLIELNGEIIRQNEDYRSRLEKVADERQTHLAAEYRDRVQKLDDDHAARSQELKQRERALEERAKALDDRDNTHARRQKQEDLNRKLQQYQTAFNLTRDTEKKRRPVSVAFMGGLAILGILVGVNTWAVFQPLPPGVPFWWHPFRTIACTLGFFGLLVYFIRWQDRWAATHADEEFRLKRLELDGVRAGWLVEVLLEWHLENRGEIPDQLIQKLGAGLFEQSAGRPEATHPVEDVLAALLGNSSSLQLELPGGKASLDRKGLDRAKAAGA